MIEYSISSRDIYEDYTSDFPFQSHILYAVVQHLGSAIFAGAEASLHWYKDMFNSGRQAVQYQALVPTFCRSDTKGKLV